MCPNVSAERVSVAGMDYIQSMFCSVFVKPSDGLEPSTPSLPWRFRGGTGGHRRALAITFLAANRAFAACLACPRVPARARADVPVSYPRRVVCSRNRRRSRMPCAEASVLRAADRVRPSRRTEQRRPLRLPFAGRSQIAWNCHRGMTGAEQRSDSELLLAARTCSEPFGSSTSGTWLRCFAFFRRRVPGCWSVAAHLLGGPGCPPHGGRASGLFGTPALSGAG
jgi:hypothetical protein